MKSPWSVLASILFSFSLLSSGNISAQRLLTWVGGSPGAEQNWNCPRNWSPNEVPNEFSDVCIPDVSSGSGAFPVIYRGVSEVNSILMDSNASLKVAKGATLLVCNGLNGSTKNDLMVSGLIIEWNPAPQNPEAELAGSLRRKVKE